jgi:hypothetical protein
MGERQAPGTRLIFLGKVLGLRVHRVFRDLDNGPRRWPSTMRSPALFRVEVRSPLFVEDRESELAYEMGKVANLRAAVGRLDGVEVPSGELFSFWKQIGRATRRRGFVSGRMLQSGCVVPAIGGGLCQLSNVLYELALRTDCEIVERHPHSVRLTGMPLHDATVAWNYIDLRFRPRTRMRMEWKLSGTELIGAFEFDEPVVRSNNNSLPVLKSIAGSMAVSHSVETCGTCAEVGCQRHEAVLRSSAGRQAFLVDGFWPEFDLYLQETRRPGDWLMLPIDGQRWHSHQYSWSRDGFSHVTQQALRTLGRSLRLRRLASQGAARQTELLRMNAAMGQAMAARLPASASHVVIDQTLLPAVWQSGALGGRTFDVLMRRLPMRVLQARLDSAAERWPTSRTAADFRVGNDLLDAEDEALQAAAHAITPHHEIAGLFGSRAILLDWIPPARRFMCQADGEIPRIFFPGPVAARKGAYELREALRGLDIEVICGGSLLEGENFWGPLKNRRGLADGEGITAVVQPAYVEEHPNILLSAVASGVPCIATEACGLGLLPGVETLPLGEIESLRTAVEGLLALVAV